MVNTTTCNLCSQTQQQEGALEPVHRIYIGESSRTLAIRAGQHVNDCNKAAKRSKTNLEVPSSFMWDHISEAHGGSLGPDTKDAFRFEILSSFRNPLERQITEATRFNQALNRLTLTNMKDKAMSVVSLNRRHQHFSPIERWEEDQNQ